MIGSDSREYSPAMRLPIRRFVSLVEGHRASSRLQGPNPSIPELRTEAALGCCYKYRWLQQSVVGVSIFFSVKRLTDEIDVTWCDLIWFNEFRILFYFISHGKCLKNVWRKAGSSKQIRRTKEKTWSSWKRKTFQWGQGFSALEFKNVRQVKTHPWGFS